MDEVRLKDELLAKLSNQLDREALQVIDGALSSVLRDYEVSKRETGLSTEIVTWPEYDIFMAAVWWILQKHYPAVWQLSA